MPYRSVLLSAVLLSAVLLSAAPVRAAPAFDADTFQAALNCRMSHTEFAVWAGGFGDRRAVARAGIRRLPDSHFAAHTYRLPQALLLQNPADGSRLASRTVILKSSAVYALIDTRRYPNVATRLRQEQQAFAQILSEALGASVPATEAVPNRTAIIHDSESGTATKGSYGFHHAPPITGRRTRSDRVLIGCRYSF